MIKLLICVSLLNSIGVLADGEGFLEVKIDQGILKGKRQQTWNGRDYYSFSAIPYAKPPVGELRFKPPVPAGPWDGVLNATELSPICPQKNIFINDHEIKGSEDCLYLNIYTPQLKSGDDSPYVVMFYIHGGGFFIGSGNPDLYGPNILLDKNVVLVTINYRLGALGFLSTEDTLIPGNWGLKDQNLALKWVKNNIIHFGGNPDKIMVFGQSAGGASTHYQVLSPLSKDLISGAIAQSGSALAPWALAPKGWALTNAKKLAEYVNCTSESKESMIECLSKVNAYDIIAQEGKFAVFSYDPIAPFRPVVEPNIEGAFITEHPVDIIKSGNSANIPFISGITTEDGALRSAGLYNDSSLIEELNKDFERLAPVIFMYEDNPQKNEITKKIRHFYFQDRNIDNSTKTELTNLFTDSWLLYPQAASVRLHAKYTTNPVVYSFIFGVHGRFSLSKVYGDPGHDYGVCHGDELFYIFSTEILPDYKPNESEKKLSDIITSLWTSFALHGDPTTATDSLIKTKWEKTESDVVSSYFFNAVDDIKMVKDTYKERIEFWLNLDINDQTSKIKKFLE